MLLLYWNWGLSWTLRLTHFLNIESFNHLIFITNQSTGFDMMKALVLNKRKLGATF